MRVTKNVSAILIRTLENEIVRSRNQENSFCKVNTDSALKCSDKLKTAEGFSQNLAPLLIRT